MKNKMIFLSLFFLIPLSLLGQNSCKERYMVEFLLKSDQVENTNPHNVAYLYDRIQINKGGKQRYGTQMRIIENNVSFINLEDEKNLEYYRACYQLPPIYVYKKALEGWCLKSE